MAYFMGVDGGGSTLRVVITDEHLHEIARIARSAVNPSVVGRETATERILQAIMTCLSQAHLTMDDIDAVAAGIAGAFTAGLLDWVADMLRMILPSSYVVAVSDVEVALVGAHEQEYGILVLAGTGSVGFAINRAGERLHIGGRGYLAGDEGGGYWLSMEAIRLLFHVEDGLHESDSKLPARILSTLKFKKPNDLIRWLYGTNLPPVQQVAALAPIVLEMAHKGDTAAIDIVERGAQHLAGLVFAMRRRLKMPDDSPIAFAGSLLTHDNLLSQTLTKKLALPEPPKAGYSPVIGAALLAKLRYPG